MLWLSIIFTAIIFSTPAVLVAGVIMVVNDLTISNMYVYLLAGLAIMVELVVNIVTVGFAKSAHLLLKLANHHVIPDDKHKICIPCIDSQTVVTREWESIKKVQPELLKLLDAIERYTVTKEALEMGSNMDILYRVHLNIPQRLNYMDYRVLRTLILTHSTVLGLLHKQK